MFYTPILYIVFNRLDTVQKTFESICNIKPKEFYIASDGARKNKIGEEEKILKVRNYILQNIDWECNVHTLFRDENVGCKYGPAGAIKWFFENVEQGVVLEDDILATPSFFEYCETMLEKYKDAENIGYICGCTMEKYVSVQDDCFLTTVIDGWGWASWQKKIKDFNPDYASLLDKKLKDVVCIFRNKHAKKSIMRLSLEAASNEIDGWDYQMADYMAVRGRYSLFPRKPLVRNIGFMLDSTHTAEAPSWYTDNSYDFDVHVPDTLVIDEAYTKKYESDFYDNHTLIIKILSKITPKWLKIIYKRNLK